MLAQAKEEIEKHTRKQFKLKKKDAHDVEAVLNKDCKTGNVYVSGIHVGHFYLTTEDTIIQYEIHFYSSTSND